jgi:hypothetical protein
MAREFVLDIADDKLEIRALHHVLHAVEHVGAVLRVEEAHPETDRRRSPRGQRPGVVVRSIAQSTRRLPNPGAGLFGNRHAVIVVEDMAHGPAGHICLARDIVAGGSLRLIGCSDTHAM